MLTVDSRLVVLLLMGRASFISEATLFQINFVGQLFLAGTRPVYVRLECRLVLQLSLR